MIEVGGKKYESKRHSRLRVEKFLSNGLRSDVGPGCGRSTFLVTARCTQPNPLSNETQKNVGVWGGMEVTHETRPPDGEKGPVYIN